MVLYSYYSDKKPTNFEIVQGLDTRPCAFKLMMFHIRGFLWVFKLHGLVIDTSLKRIQRACKDALKLLFTIGNFGLNPFL